LKRYMSSIGEARASTARMHGIFRREFIQKSGDYLWNHSGIDHVLISRSEFYGSIYNANTSYIRRLWDTEKLKTHKNTGASYRYFDKSNKQYGLKRLTFVPLYGIYINDFLRLPLGKSKIVRNIPLLIFTVTKKFEINFINNLIIYLFDLFLFHFRKIYSGNARSIPKKN